MKKQPVLALACLAALILSGCQSVQRDVTTSFNSSVDEFRQALNDFRPFDVAGSGPSQQTSRASLVDPVQKQDLPPPGQQAAQQLSFGGTPVTVTAIESTSSTGPNCPNVRIVNDLNQVHQFTDTTNPVQETTISSILMQGVETQCKTAKNGLGLDITLAFEGVLGPKGRVHGSDKPTFAYPYFVAITDKQGRIIGKEVFAMNIAYDRNITQKTHTERIRQTIPGNAKNAKDYKVLIGFQLNDQELAFNRALPPSSMSASNIMVQIEPAAGTPGFVPTAKN